MTAPSESTQSSQKRNQTKPKPNKQPRAQNQNQSQTGEPRNRRERRAKPDLPATPRRPSKEKAKKSATTAEQKPSPSKPHNGDLNLNNDLKSKTNTPSKPHVPRTPSASSGSAPKDKGPNTSFSGNSFHASPAASSLPRPTFHSPAKPEATPLAESQNPPLNLPGVAHYGQTMMPPFGLPPNQRGSPAMYAYPVGPQGMYAMPPATQQWPMGSPQPLNFANPGPYVMLNPNQHPLPGPGQGVPLPIPGFFAPPPVAHPTPKMGVTDPRLFAK